MATVTDIQETVPASIPPSYILFARWQDPKTDHIYTLRTPLREHTLFAIGSPIAFLIDPDNPEDHIAQFLVDKEKA
jgi:hypothetical protein